MSFLRGEQDIDTSVRKAISPEETNPKRKHVRACVVYTWDHRDGKQFWHAVRMLPIQSDPVMTFKALIVIHKVLHEGHRTVLKEAQHHVEWIRSLASGGHGGPYRQLIEEYVRLLLHKLEFHRVHPLFNGTFEYEEYISLRHVDDPNEGYEAVTDLMHLQDSIFDYQRLVFASLGAASRRSSGTSGQECRSSSLTAMVTESYGIYRFITSMLRALHQQSDEEVLAPLRQRYEGQHRRLRMFYADCRGIKYLASIISIPELPRDAPDLLESNERAPQLPKRPREHRTGESLAPQSTGATELQPIVPEATGNWWQGQQQFVPESTLNNELAQQQALEEQHIQYLQQREQELAMERQRQEQLALQAQQQFEAEQAALLAQQQQQQQDLLRQQQQMQYQDQAVAMQQELALLRSQQEEAQSMLQQYDQRVQSLESDLSQMTSLTQQQIDAKTEQLDSMQEQVDTWKSKYESLAKLYSQLRHEHLELMSKFRKVQTKAASAQEAIDKREKAERDLKSKNLELADLIRERDRARYELDKSKGHHSDEVERLERNISLLNDRISENDRTRASDFSSLSGSHARQIGLLETQLAEKERQLHELGGTDAVKGKDEEIMILNQQIEQMSSMMNELSLDGKSGNISSILDAILVAAYETIQQSLTAFDSPVDSGNPVANPPFVLSITDSASSAVDAFSNAFTDYVAEGPTGDPVQIITGATTLSLSMSDLLKNVRGLAAYSTSQSEEMSDAAREAATSLLTFYSSLQSEMLESLPDIDDKIELVVTNHVEVAKYLQDVAILVEGMIPKTHLGSGSLDSQVDGAMANLENAVADATKRVAGLRQNAAHYAVFDRAVNEAIIEAAAAITSAIALLIKASMDCQQEIVSKGRQGESPEHYYKKNHRWTEGLISAARTVGGATNVLIDTADGTLGGKRTPEELIVASREVASSIAQLVASSRVKAGYLSKTQPQLESASKTVTTACRALVTQVEDMLAKGRPDARMIDYSKLSPMEFKSASMEQQVEVLKLEQDLTLARNRLFEIRRLEYANLEDE